MSSQESAWADGAPKYKKDGNLYASVEYDADGTPARIRLAEDQIRRGEFNVEGGVAVYDPHDVITLSQAGKRERDYVESLPFVESVEMSGNDE